MAEHPFVTGVRRALADLDEARYQDQLDLMMLGGAPSEPVRYPDSECGDCSGEGWLCGCHGIALSWSRQDHGALRSERVRCDCWKRRAATHAEPLLAEGQR